MATTTTSGILLLNIMTNKYQHIQTTLTSVLNVPLKNKSLHE